LIRQFFPKGTDLARQPASRISQVQELLNHRPRRCLGYRTPMKSSSTPAPVAIET
jgi:IS30 family transposase